MGKGGGGTRVLVVDSDPYRRVFMVQLLTELGVRVLMAGDAAEARAMVTTLGARIGAVVISAAVDGVAGVQLASELAAEPGDRRVLLVTEAGAATQDLPAGVRALSKPLTRDKLVELLHLRAG